jgi:hypothetical protein
MFRREPDRLTPWALALGAAASASALSYGVLRLLRRQRRRPPASSLDSLEEAAVDVLRRDAQTGACAIDVAALAPGIIELTGVAPTQEIGQRAVRLMHGVQGVRTVLNRLETGSLESRLAENRSSRTGAEPHTRERHWYGMRVGMGRRRQSLGTEPARNDDTVPRRMRELEVRAADIAEATQPDPESPGDGAADPMSPA